MFLFSNSAYLPRDSYADGQVYVLFPQQASIVLVNNVKGGVPAVRDYVIAELEQTYSVVVRGSSALQ